MIELKTMNAAEIKNIVIISLMIISVNWYNQFFYKPTNSIELYKSIAFSEDFEEGQELMLEGYESNLKEEDYNYISREINSPYKVNQFTLFEYGNKTYILLTTPGTKKVEVLKVEELPVEIRNYFLELTSIR